MNLVVGHCFKCGAPIYAGSQFSICSPPQYTCSCAFQFQGWIHIPEGFSFPQQQVFKFDSPIQLSLDL